MQLPLVLLTAVLAAPTAWACKCNAASLEDATRAADVVAFVDVGAARAEPDGAQSAPIRWIDVLRGPTAPDVRVWWEKPNGKSCHLTDLRPGTWLVFLSWGLDGRLTLQACDLQSTRLDGAAAWTPKRTAIVALLERPRSSDDAAAIAARAVRGALLASMAGKSGTEFAGDLAARDLARADRAQVKKQAKGAFVVTWSQHPPAGFAVDAEVRVTREGVAHVVRAEASFSPD